MIFEIPKGVRHYRVSQQETCPIGFEVAMGLDHVLRSMVQSCMLLGPLDLSLALLEANELVVEPDRCNARGLDNVTNPQRLIGLAVH